MTSAAKDFFLEEELFPLLLQFQGSKLQLDGVEQVTMDMAKVISQGEYRLYIQTEEISSEVIQYLEENLQRTNNLTK